MYQLPDEWIESLRIRYGVMGIGAVVVQKESDPDGDRWSSVFGTYGVANAQGAPITKRSMFGLASNSKLFTAIAVGLVIEDRTILPNGEMLEWSTKIKDIFPQWHLNVVGGDELVDVIDLLSMRTGMPQWDNSKAIVPPSELIEAMSQLKPSDEVRRTHQYSNWNYNIASEIIPTLTGKSYVEFVKERIFEPVGLTDATLNVEDALSSGNRTDGYLRKGLNYGECEEAWQDKSRLDKEDLGAATPFGWFAGPEGIYATGAAGVILSIEDMARWVQELLEPRVLPRSILDKVVHPNIPFNGGTYPERTNYCYGLGQRVWSYRGIDVSSHTGMVAGQRTFLLRTRDDRLGIMIAANDSEIGMDLIRVIMYRILDDHLGLDPIDWEARLVGDWVRSISKRKIHNLMGPEWPLSPSPFTLTSKDIIGRYTHPVSGALEIIPLSDYTTANPHFQIISAAVGDDTTAPGPHYVSVFNKVWWTHIVLSPVSGRLVKWTLLQLFKVIDHKRENTGEWIYRGLTGRSCGTAYVAEDGIGMFGNFWGAGDGVPVVQARPEMLDVEVKAKMWFAKI